MEIEGLKKEHIPQLVRLEAECFGACAWNEAAFLSEMQNESSVCFCAVDSAQVLGCIAMSVTPEQGFISKVMTHPAYRRQGIAKALLASFIAYAKEKGFEELSLEVRESNTAAIHLYASFDFEIIGKRRQFYRHPKEDAVIMTKRL